MGQTITEKILAAHAGKESVKPGELINVKVDIVLGNDVTAPLAIKEFRKIGLDKVFDAEKVIFVPDHFTPNMNIKAAQQAKEMRDFALAQGLVNYFEIGQMGIEHALLPEEGLVLPGDVIIGADSHTCTYGGLGAFSTGVGSTDLAAGMATGEAWLKVPAQLRFNFEGRLQPWVTGKDLILYTIGQIGVDGALYRTMEFTGSVITGLSIDSRLSLCNMAIEAGAKNGIIASDDRTEEYLKSRAKRRYTIYQSDPDAEYEGIYNFKAEDIQPQIAFPHLPSNTKNINEISKIMLDQVVIGSCTNGRLEDLEIAANIIEGHKVAKNLRLIIIPATQKIYLKAIKDGLIEKFIEAGAAVSTPTCGPCLGGHMGVLAAGEKALATTNRNFIGRMGHPESEVYLSNPAIAAASAIAGYITGPDNL